jgi:hypothetical protein
MVLTAYSALSSVIGLSCHRRPADMVTSAPGRADLTSAGLDAGVEASGPHDFTVRVSAVRLRAGDRSRETRPAIPSRARRCRVHRIPSRVRDDRDTPLVGDETARVIVLIWVKREPEYFCKQDWTATIRLIRFNKSPCRGLQRQRKRLPLQRHSGMVRRTRPQMCNCTSGNLAIPGSLRSLSSGRALRGPVGSAPE